MSITDGLITLAFKLDSAIIQDRVKTEIDQAIKQLADKYATSFDVKWKTVCNEQNNPQAKADAHTFVVDVYLTVPLIMSDFAHAHVEVTFSSTPSLPK